MAFAYPARDPGAGTFAIRDLTFEVRAGETFGVIGPNASGKTTLVRLLSRVLTPSGGRIRLEGRDLSGHGLGEDDGPQQAGATHLGDERMAKRQNGIHEVLAGSGGM